MIVRLSEVATALSTQENWHKFDRSGAASHASESKVKRIAVKL
jgi:hypothetical protein